MKRSGTRVPAAVRWIGDHAYASLWIVLAPFAAAALALNTAADWIAVTLFGLAGLSWSGVLMPVAVRHAAVPMAGTVAALSGGTMALILGDTASHSTPETTDETAILLLALLAAGAAALLGQLKNQADQRRSERQLSEQLAALAERQSAELAELRVELASMIQAHRGQRRTWWPRD